MQFEALYVFGDSLSDPGNLFALSLGLFPPAPYFQGRTSNGLVWSEYFATLLGLSPAGLAALQANPNALTQGINFAIAGANSDNSNSNDDNPLKPANIAALPGLTTQLEAYQGVVAQLGPSATDNALHVLWVGANDYLGGGQTNPQVPLTNIANALESLYSGGARTFLVANLPLLGNTPLGQFLAPGPLNALTAVHNRGLSLLLYQFEQRKTDARVILFDSNAVFEEVQKNPSALGFSTTGGCFTLAELFFNPPDPLQVQACGETALFWDDLHPTTRAHSILADRAWLTLEVDFAPRPLPGSLVWDTVTGELSKLALDGDRAIASLSPLGRRITDQAWQLQATGDLNGDGQADVLLRNFRSGQNLVLFLNAGGNGIQSEALIGRDVPDPNWSLAGTGDLDGDGQTDIILRNQAADQIVAWYLDGDGNITREGLVGRGFGDSSWKIVATADFNGDGQTDLLLQHQAAGQILLWEMDGVAIHRESLLGRPVDSNWFLEGAGDFDGNGTTDVWLRHRAAGQSVLWSMADKTVIGAEILLAGGPGGSRQLVL